jgi:hypothetical protein
MDDQRDEDGSAMDGDLDQAGLPRTASFAQIDPGNTALGLSASEGPPDGLMEHQNLELSTDLRSAIDNHVMFDPAWVGDSDHADPYFDFMSFARPWNYAPQNAETASNWFSNQFFAAVRETDLAYSPPNQRDWSGSGLPYADNTDFSQNSAFTSGLPTSGREESPSDGRNHTLSDVNLTQLREPGGISRVPSPPNEASHEDRIPFAWNPRSARVATAKPVILPSDDPIFQQIERDLEISDHTLSKLCDFLRPQDQQPLHQDSFTMPTLPLINVFISLFFKRFAPQAPVLHRPSVDVNALPSPLLAIIVVVGSSYSRLRNTRRFGIIVFDRIRRNLLALIEADNNLMREPSIIYALALTCFMGLWCGNKRAFELAEALRASVVTYTRRLPGMGSELHHGHRSAAQAIIGSTPSSDRDETVRTRWTRWVTAEGRKRLCWFIYTLDSQFVSVLGMSGMMTLAETRRWECPCDEGFWNAPTARSWKNLLGSASEPPCPVYGQIAASLLPTMGSAPGLVQDHFLPRTNNWTGQLLLTAIMAEVFHFEQTAVVLRMGMEELDEDATGQPTFGTQASSPWSQIVEPTVNLRHALQVWHEAYACIHPSPRFDVTSAYFGRAAMIIFHLARLYLAIPLSDIQDCLGRSGPADARTAIMRLTAWAVQNKEETYDAIENAAICITFIIGSGDECAPYDVIGLFLSHVVIWAIAKSASTIQRANIVRRLQDNRGLSSEVCEFIEAGFVAEPALILKHAIQSLVQVGTWGASSNLALLLHHTSVST